MNIHEETLKIARNLIEKDPSLTDWVISKFPELKESDDERIRKALISYCQVNMGNIWNGINQEDYIAWLEKQGEVPITININKMVEDYANNKERSNEGFGKPVNCMIRAYRQGLTDAIVALKSEKRDKQKSANNSKPKFHKGDWIILNGIPLYIKEVVESFYETITRGGINNRYYCDIDDIARLWTIQDAKDGDVLCYKDEIFLYKHDIKNCTKEETTFGGFVYHCCYDSKRFIIDSLYSLSEQDKMDIHPAIKEQRDTLEKAMANAGYTFDFEKKELNQLSYKKEN